jgi:protocatechuate 3,4-dioxygenase beta subunit
LPPAATALTDAQGNAALQGVQPGSYSLTARRDGFSVNTSETTVAVAAGQPTPEVSLVLVRAGGITGRVIDSRGAPVVNATLILGTVVTQTGQRSFKRGPLASTNDRGEFRVADIRPGEYVIRIQTGVIAGSPVYNSYNEDLNQAKIIAVKPGETLMDFEIRLP